MAKNLEKYTKLLLLRDKGQKSVQVDFIYEGKICQLTIHYLEKGGGDLINKRLSEMKKSNLVVYPIIYIEIDKDFILNRSESNRPGMGLQKGANRDK